MIAAYTSTWVAFLAGEPGDDEGGKLLSKVIARGRKARLGDALIAQSCIDRKVPLLTRDRDFRAFVESAGLDMVAWA